MHILPIRNETNALLPKLRQVRQVNVVRRMPSFQVEIFFTDFLLSITIGVSIAFWSTLSYVLKDRNTRYEIESLVHMSLHVEVVLVYVVLFYVWLSIRLGGNLMMIRCYVYLFVGGNSWLLSHVFHVLVKNGYWYLILECFFIPLFYGLYRIMISGMVIGMFAMITWELLRKFGYDPESTFKMPMELVERIEKSEDEDQYVENGERRSWIDDAVAYA